MFLAPHGFRSGSQPRPFPAQLSSKEGAMWTYTLTQHDMPPPCLALISSSPPSAPFWIPLRVLEMDPEGREVWGGRCGRGWRGREGEDQRWCGAGEACAQLFSALGVCT